MMNGSAPPSGGNGGRDSRMATMQSVAYLAAPAAPDPGWHPSPPPPLPPHAPTPPPVRPAGSRLRRGLFRLALVLAVLVAAAGGIYAITTYQNQSQPGAVVQSYFSALVRSDAPAALSYGDMPPGPQSLLTSAMLRKQNAVAPMGNVVILSAKPSGNFADVTVRYSLSFDGRPVTETDTVRTVRKGSTWRLAAVAVPEQIRMQEAADRAEVDGAKVPADSQLYFPGVLPLTFDTPSLELPVRQRVVHFTDTRPLNLSVEISPRGLTAAWTALDKALEQCLAGTFPAQATCPLPNSQTAVPGTLRGTTTYALEPSADRIKVDVLDQPDGGLRVQSEAVITGTYQQLDFNNLPVPTAFHGTLTLLAACQSVGSTAIVWTLL